MCRYFELCDDSSVGIWKLLFRQSGCLGPDISEEDEYEEGCEPEPRSYFTLSDDGKLMFIREYSLVAVKGVRSF